MARQRLGYADALRGVAALLVLVHHATNSTVLTAPLQTLEHPAVREFLDWTNRGVQMFFVLSGFVILLSLRNTVLDRRGAARFMARRQIRLDPAYWATIVVALLLFETRQLIPGLEARQGYSALDVVANAAYLHEILDRASILNVAWTLCIEVQFYLFLLVVAAAPRLFGWAMRRRHVSGAPDVSHPALPFVLAATGAVCLLSPDQGGAPWFTTYWYYFALGSLALLAADRRAPRWLFAALIVGVAVHGLVTPAHSDEGTGIATAALLFAARAGWFSTRGIGERGVTRWLGTRSYSIYLVHLPLLIPFGQAAYKLTGTNSAAAVLWLIAGTGLCLVAAEMLFRAVESPSLRVAARIKDVGIRGTIRHPRAMSSL